MFMPEKFGAVVSRIRNPAVSSVVYFKGLYSNASRVIYWSSLWHRETRWLTALKCRPLSRSSHKVKLGHLLSVWLYTSASSYLISLSFFFSFLHFQWATVWRTPQHEELPWCPSWRWTSCPAKSSVCFSWRTAALCQSAIKSLARCVFAQAPLTYQHVRKIHNICMKRTYLHWCFHACMCAALSSSIQARSSMKTFTQTQWAQVQPCLLRSGGREGTSR